MTMVFSVPRIRELVRGLVANTADIGMLSNLPIR